jgi:hypothetical protein
MKREQSLFHPFWVTTTRICPGNMLIWVGMLALRSLVNQNVDQKLSGARKQSSFSLGDWHFDSFFTLTGCDIWLPY